MTEVAILRLAHGEGLALPAYETEHAAGMDLPPFRGKEQVGAVYSSIIDAIPDVRLESVRRFSAEDGKYVVDESILSGHVDGEWSGMSGGGAPVRVRILHIFEVRDGLISYENAWFDASAVQRQIQAWHDSR